MAGYLLLYRPEEANIFRMAREKVVDKSSRSTRERERENKYCRSYSKDSQVKTYIFEKPVVGDFQQRDTAGNFVVHIIC